MLRGVGGKKLGLMVAGLLVLAGGLWWQRTPEAGAGKEGAKPAVVRVTAMPVQKRDVPQLVRMPGTVYANETVALKSRLDSQILDVHFQDGDRVERGALLFTLDNRALKAQRAELAANLQRDTVQLKNAKAQFERSEKLSAQGYTTTEKLQQDRTAYEAQQASVGATKAALDNLDVQLDYTLIRAPISGRAGTIAVTQGNTVKANDATPLVTINQIDPILVQFAVPQRYYDQLKTAMSSGKMPVQAVRAETGVTLAGNLEYIDNAIDQSNGAFTARARFGNAEEKLWPGMFVDVVLTLGTLRDPLVIPANAVQGGEGAQFVYAVSANGTAERRPVKAQLQDDNIAVILEGVRVGEQIVTDGLLRVTDGAKIETAPAAADPKLAP